MAIISVKDEYVEVLNTLGEGVASSWGRANAV